MNKTIEELVNILNKTIEEIKDRNQEIDDRTKKEIAWELLETHHNNFRVYEQRINAALEQLDYVTTEKEEEIINRRIDNAVLNQGYILNELLNKTIKVSK